MLEEFEYLIGGELLRIEHQFYSHLFEQQLVLCSQEFIVVNPGCHFACAEVLCEKGADDVDILRNVGNHGDEQVGFLDIRFAHVLER